MTRWIHLRGVSVDYEDGYNHGAAVAFGLMGMAEAIRARSIEPCCECGAEQWLEPDPGPYLCARCA